MSVRLSSLTAKTAPGKMYMDALGQLHDVTVASRTSARGREM